MGKENIAMSDEWGILPISTSPQMRINIPIFHLKMKYFDLFFYSTDQKKIFSAADAKKNLFSTLLTRFFFSFPTPDAEFLKNGEFLF